MQTTNRKMMKKDIKSAALIQRPVVAVICFNFAPAIAHQVERRVVQ